MIPTMTTPLPTKQPPLCGLHPAHPIDVPPRIPICPQLRITDVADTHASSWFLGTATVLRFVNGATPTLPPQPPTLSQHLGIHHQPDHPVEQSNGVAPVIAYYSCWAKESCCWCCMFTRPPLRLRGRFFFWFLHSLYVWNAQAFTTVFSSLHASPSPPPSTHYMAPWPRSFLPSLRFIMASVLLLLQLPLLF